MTLSEKLLAIADECAANVAVWEAEIAEHRLHGETAEVRRKEKRAAKGREWSEACQHAAKLLKAREKRGKFVPPTFEELWTFCLDELPWWPRADVEKWFDHFNANGWRVGGKAQMADWKAAARNGARNWKDKNPQAMAKKEGDEDPTRWRDFILGRPYQPYKYAPAHLKNDFAKWLKSR